MKQVLLRAGVMAVALSFAAVRSDAQLSSNPDKFLGNITTSYQVDYGNEKFYQLWNQITPENESKWSSIEGSRRGSFNWSSDAAYNYARQHSFPFKFHCLIWGAQYPGWLDNLPTEQQYKAIEEWMDAIKAHYSTIDMIDVVNEAVPGHQPAPYKEALGGDGKTGYDWIIKAFEMAYERWPDAILIYNDFNTFQWQRSEFIDLVRKLRNAGAPIDAYGCQSHDLTDMDVSSFKSAMTEIQSALKMPMYSSEYDIGTSDDNLQLQRYQEQIPYMWEADYCAGITLWGYIYGHTWTTDGNSGIKYENGTDRPAMKWLREYMKSDKAKQAKSPFPGMKKEASVYVKPASLNVTKGEAVPIEIRARLRTKTIDHIDFYVNNQLQTTLTAEPYTTEYVPESNRHYDLKAVVVATDGTQYQRLSGFTAYNPRTPFRGAITLPGTLQSENFDSGAEGDAYHDSDSNNQGGTSYRTDGTGVDVVSKNGGYAIGYTNTGEWLEYTVDVQEAGYYEFDAYVAAGDNNNDGSFRLDLSGENGLQALSDVLPVRNTGGWGTLKAVHGRTLVPLETGEQRIRFTVTHSGFDIDRITFKHVEVISDMQMALHANPSPATVNDYSTLSVAITPDDVSLKNVKYYIDGVLARTVAAAPYEYKYRPTATGTYAITAIATDDDDRVSPVAALALKVLPKRTSYRVMNLPGIVEAENFDKGGEGFTFHDSDNKDEGKAGYRTDNEGVDIVKGNTGYVIGYSSTGEWLEYTVNVKEAGKYACEATVSSGVTGSGFTIGVVNEGQVTTVARINVPKTGDNNWDTYRTVKVNLSKPLAEGKQILRFTITGSNCNIDKVEFKCTLPDGIEAPDSDQPTVINQRYNLAGQKVGAGYRGIVIVNGRKVVMK